MNRYEQHLVEAQRDEEQAHLRHQQDLEAELAQDTAEHARDLVREGSTRLIFTVRCWACHQPMGRKSEFPGMWSRHEDCNKHDDALAQLPEVVQ